MSLYRSPLVMVVVVVLSVWAKMARARTDSHPLLKHFDIYGCHINKTLFSNVNTKFLKHRPEIFIGLSGTFSPTTIGLVSSSSPPCKLPPNVLFRALPSTKTVNKLLTVIFYPVVFEDQELTFGEGNATDNQVVEEQIRGNSSEEGEGQDNMTCNFNVDDVVTLQSGYGFISCQADPVANKLWMEWQEGVTAAEEEATHARTNIIIVVVCGTGGVAITILACVLCRLVSARSVAYDSRRRPSNTSGRTGSTHDHLSSRI